MVFELIVLIFTRFIIFKVGYWKYISIIQINSKFIYFFPKYPWRYNIACCEAGHSLRKGTLIFLLMFFSH